MTAAVIVPPALPADPTRLGPLALMQSVRDTLLAAGIRATFDVRELNPPGVVVLLPILGWRFRDGDIEATHRVLAVGPNTSRLQQLTDLDALVNQIQAALGGRVDVGNPADVSTQDATSALAAYELSWTEHVRRRKS